MELLKIKCERCQKDIEPILTVSGPHVKATCPDCLRYIKFINVMLVPSYVDSKLAIQEITGGDADLIKDGKAATWFMKNQDGIFKDIQYYNLFRYLNATII